ncbi:MAG: hypothetical protein K6B75_02310 [Lachnospiraceae bacterium]|nr:hypothetical protein [Lachnospiraceae bacterium]
MFFSFTKKSKLNGLKRLVDEERFKEAAKKADSISDRQIQTTTEMMLLGRAYFGNAEYQKAKKYFKLANDKRCSKYALTGLINCYIELGETGKADLCFEKYKEVAPYEEQQILIFNYRIEKNKGTDVSQLLPILVRIKEEEFTEEYGYELAFAYFRLGMHEECINECNELITWFGRGVWVEKARLLTAYYNGEISLEEIQAGNSQLEEQEHLEEEVERSIIAEERKHYAEIEAAGEDGTAEYSEEDEEAALAQAIRAVTDVVMSGETTEKVVEYANTEHNNELFEQQQLDLGVPEGFEYASEEVINEEFAGKEPEEGPEEEPEEPRDAEGFIQQQLELEEPTMAEETMKDIAELQEEERYMTRELYELYRPVYEGNVQPVKGSKSAKLIAEKGVDIEEICRNFARIESIRKQILRTVEMAANERGRINLVVTGEEKSDRTELSLSVIKLLYKLGIIKYERTAIVDSSKLNPLDVEKHAIQFTNCNIIITHAGSAHPQKILALSKIGMATKENGCVVLEDSSKNINSLLRGGEELSQKFNNRIHLSRYTEEDLLGFAYDEAQKSDYGIDLLAAEGIKEKISECYRKNSETALEETKKIIEYAILRAEARTSKKLLEMVAHGVITNGNYTVLIADDIMQ